MYGSLVVQIVKDYEDPISVNQQLEKMYCLISLSEIDVSEYVVVSAWGRD